MKITLNFKTPLQKLSLIDMLLFLAAIVFLMVHQYLPFAASIIALIVTGRFWYLRLGEELIIYTLKRNLGNMSKAILKEFSKGGESSLHRLEKKGIVEIDGNSVRLVDMSTVCSFGK